MSMTVRRVLVVGVLSLTVLLGAGALASAAPAALSPTSAAATASDSPNPDRHEPCVAQLECVGGIAVSAGALLLVMAPTSVAGLFAPTPSRRVVGLPAAPRSALLAAELFRPPRPS